MLPSDELQEKIELQIRKELKDWIKSWKDAVEDALEKIFNGDVETRRELFKLIDGGTLCGGNSTTEQVEAENFLEKDELQAQVEKAAWAQMIPRSWNLAGWRPVVVDGGSCDDVGAVDGIISSKTADDTNVCHNDRRYYIVAAGQPWKEGTPDCFFESPGQGGPPPCWNEGEDPLLEKLPGTDKLGDTTYGKLTLEDFIIG